MSAARTVRPLGLLNAQLPELCRMLLQAGRIPGASVAVVAGGESYFLGHGVSSLLTGQAVTPQTLFNIGSCTKAFTASLMATVVAEGLTAWDDPITRWVPEFQLQDEERTRSVSLRDCSANRVGLPRAGLPEYGLDPLIPVEDMLGRLRHTPPVAPLRHRFSYLNAGHTAVALAAGRITGRGYLRAMKELILDPAGMVLVTGGEAALARADDAAGWHRVIDDEARPIDNIFTDQYLGSGGLLVCGQDALRWLRLQLNAGALDGKAIIPAAALAETHRPHACAVPGRDSVGLFYPDALFGAYGLGWATCDIEGHRAVLHSGSDFGATAMTLMLPGEGVGIAVYANACGGPPAALALAYAIAATLLAWPPHDWLAYFERATAASVPVTDPVAPTTEPLPASLPGRYRHPADGILEIVSSNSRLTGRLLDAYRYEFSLQPHSGSRLRLEFLTPEWSASPGMPESTLGLHDEAGRVMAVELAGRRFVRETP